MTYPGLVGHIVFRCSDSGLPDAWHHCSPPCPSQESAPTGYEDSAVLRSYPYPTPQAEGTPTTNEGNGKVA